MGVVAASLELVVAIPAIDRIASEAAGYRVLTGTAVDPVIIGAAINYIIAVSSINTVRTILMAEPMMMHWMAVPTP